MSVKQILLAGDPYERGLQYGRECRDEIRISLASYRRLFLKERGLDWETSQRAASRFLPFISGRYKTYREEMRGLAEGAGVKFEEILALNCRSEILYSSLGSERTPDECTAFSAVAPATRPDVVLAGQTWDYTVAQRKALVIVRLPQEGETPARLLFLEAGMIGGMGVNAAGLCLTLNALSTEGADLGVPLRIRMRSILDQNNINDAYREAVPMPIPFAANLLITQKDGVSLSLELDPSGCDVLIPENGLLVHTNHWLGPRMVLCHQHSDMASTYCRLQTLKQNLESRKDLTAEDIEAFFRDHRGYPVSVCRHCDSRLTGQDHEDDYQTDFAFVADLKKGTVRFVEGNPCEGEFVTLTVGSELSH
ncbi:MAG: hypothetical protein J5496_07835 [Lachnospiraceae bacterium]|nr:hypothetical protein [Lachnospiraceae bacterium]